MLRVDERRFTVGVFQDVAWAQKGLAALNQAGFPKDSLSIVATDSPEAAVLLEGSLGTAGEQLELAGIGAVVARGPLVQALQGEGHDLSSWACRHDAACRVSGARWTHLRRLTGRGGVLVAIQSEPRAAEALALLHSYGGGNAAIGAWTGRV